MADLLISRVNVRKGNVADPNERVSDNFDGYPPPTGYTKLRFHIPELSADVRDKVRFNLRNDIVWSGDSTVARNLKHGDVISVINVDRGIFVCGPTGASGPFVLEVFAIP